MKRKIIKYGIFGIIILALGWNLSQCTGGNPGNMKQYEIINQIKTKMKKEMDAINFEVNFEDYEFKVEVPQSLSDFGYVTLKDKRYNYEPIRVYDGNLQKLEEDKIGVNPIIFVAHGYQDYKMGELKKQGIENLVIDVMNHLKSKGYTAKQLEFKQLVPYEGKKHAYAVNLSKLDKFRQITDYSSVFAVKSVMMENDYTKFFNNKTTNGMNYKDFENELKYQILLTFVINQNIQDLDISVIQKNIQNEKIVINIIEGDV